MAKQRVYDLAKNYGMTGQELAAKLRDLGFPVKSHMTALDDFQVLEIQARLEAYGIVGESSGQAQASVAGLKIRRKKKKPAPAAEPAPTREPAPEPAAPAAGAPGEAPAPAAEQDVPAAETVTAAAQEPAPVAPAAPAEPEQAEEDEAEEPAPLLFAATTEADTEDEEEELPDVRVAKRKVRARRPEKVEEDEEAEAEPEAVPTEESESDEIVRPSASRRSGKVVGFIDPSQFQTQQKRRSESRRLSSSDDVLPEVRPTFGRDRHSGVVRGDTTRGSLTAQQLREREAGRFLRRRRIQQTGPGGGGRRGPAVREAVPTNESPHAGGTVAIEFPITIKKLANSLAVKENHVLRTAFEQVGAGININSLIDEETAVLLAHEYSVELDIREEVAAEATLLQSLEDKRKEIGEEELIQRAPTVAVLGHVDHGKTTLIDSIRRSRIAAAESGGITQHIGAYQVTTRAGHRLTVVDTPGHAAFTHMRARGARAVDVAILVVAADDGVKPQTEEAVNHARAAGTPIVVALNKIDKPEANVDKVKTELAALNLTPEEWGGDVAMLPVSALKGTGVDELLERVFLESEVLELQSHPKGPARGVVLEAEIQQGKGKVAHLLVQDGSLRRGDVILAGEGYGKVRSIHDDHGDVVVEAGPSSPVEVTGLNELPTIGDQFYVVESLEEAQQVAEERARKNRLLSQIERRHVSHENILDRVAEQDRPTINLIVKADVQGSVEVLKHQLSELKHDEVEVKVVHAGVGQVLESDVDLAVTSGARILAFHTSPQNKVRQLAERSGIEIKVYRVIYELLDDIRAFMEGELSPEFKEEVLGHAEVRRVFKSSKFGNIAGCYVLDGKIARSAKARLLRDSQVVYTGSIGSLRRESDDTKEVREGFECGILLKDYNDVREGDVIEAFKMIEVKRTL